MKDREPRHSEQYEQLSDEPRHIVNPVPAYEKPSSEEGRKQRKADYQRNYYKNYYQNNTQKEIERVMKWQKDNPDKFKASKRSDTHRLTRKRHYQENIEEARRQGREGMRRFRERHKTDNQPI